MTWGFASKNMVTGDIAVSCHSTAGGIDCNAYEGDTSCKKQLPILCAYRDAANFPLPPHDINLPPYDAWAAEVVHTTAPVAPCVSVAHLSQANQICQAEFGPNWYVAEFHDGTAGGGVGWGFQAHGNVGKLTKRFWVDIVGQPATCWDRN